jgi:peptide chain release factor subunit 3
MYLTGMVEKRTLEKYEREAKEKNRETWYLSWALDTNLEGQFINILLEPYYERCL